MIGIREFFSREARATRAMDALHRTNPMAARALAARYQTDGNHASVATSVFTANLLPDALLSLVDKKIGAALFPRFAKLPDSDDAFPYTPNPNHLWELMPDPGHKVTIGGLWIATTDGSNAMWNHFLADTGRAEHAERAQMDKRFRNPRLLALYLSLNDACEYGDWLTQKLRTNYGLRVTIRPPYEHELKYAGLAGRNDLNTIMTANGRFEVGQADFGKDWDTEAPAAVDAAHIARIRFGDAEYMPLSGGGWRPTLTPFDPNGDANIVSWFGASWLYVDALSARAGFRCNFRRGGRIEDGGVRWVASEDS